MSEIVVSPLFLREKRSEKRKQSVQVKAVNRAKDRHSRQRKFQDKQVTFHIKDTRHLAQRPVPIPDVSKTERDCDAIKGTIRERKRKHISYDRFPQTFSPRHGKHLFGKIGTDNL